MSLHPCPDPFPHKIVGDARRRIYHDLRCESGHCLVDTSVAAGEACYFVPDEPAEAERRGFMPCRFCHDRVAA